MGRPRGAARTGCMVHGGCRTVACRAATWHVGWPHGMSGGHMGPPVRFAFFLYRFYDVSRWPHGTTIRADGHMGPPVRVVWFTAGVVPWRVGRPHGAAPTVRIFFVLFFMMFATITHGAARTGGMLNGWYRNTVCRVATWYVGRPHRAARTGCMVHGGCRTVACWTTTWGRHSGGAATWGRPYGLYFFCIVFMMFRGGHMGPPFGRAATWGRPYGSHFFCIVFMMFRGGHTGPPFGRTATWGRPYGLYGSRRVSYRGVLGGHMGPPLRFAFFSYCFL